MKFCNKCGAEITNGQKFCEKCGANIETLAEAEIQNNEVQVTNEVDTKLEEKEKNIKSNKKIEVLPKKVAQTKVGKNTKSSKMVLGIVGTIVILFLIIIGSIIVFLGLKIGLTKHYSPEKVVARFEEAITEGDVNTLELMLYNENAELLADDFQVKALIRLCQENDGIFQYMIAQLNEDISNSNEIEFKKPEEVVNENKVVGIMLSNKNFLFKKYSIIIKNLPLYVNSKGINASAYMEDEEIAINNSNEEQWKVGEFIPGIYDVTLKAKDLLGNNISDTQSVDTVYLYNIEFFEDYGVYSVYSNIPEATLYVNNTNTNILVNDAGVEFGPININDDIVGKYTLNNKEYTSQVAAYYEDGNDGIEDGYDSIVVDFDSNDYYEIQDTLEYKQNLEVVEDNAQVYINKYKNSIIPDSSSRELTFMDLNMYNGEELFIAHNEILARHGQVFHYQPILQKYFESKGWYEPNSRFNGELTNELEKNNYNNLRTVEFSTIAKQKCSPIYSDYVFPYSDEYRIKSYELTNLSDWELIVARNEIFARYGLEFSTKDLIDYFQSKSWFRINRNIGNDVQINDVERDNVQTILKEEKARMNYVLSHDLGEEYY